MSSSAVSGGHHAHWQQMQAQVGAQARTATAGSSAPSSDLTDMLAGADPSQATAPPPPSTGWPSNGNSNAASGGRSGGAAVSGTEPGSAASALVSGVRSLLTSLQSELSGSAPADAAPNGAAPAGAASGSSAASNASSSNGATASGTASAGSGTPDEAGMLGQIMQMLQAYGAQSSIACTSSSMTSSLIA